MNCEVEEGMTGKEILNLIYKLKSEGKTDAEIIDFISVLETHDPNKNDKISDSK